MKFLDFATCQAAIAMAQVDIHAFGKGAAGNADTLRELLELRGIQTVIVENVQRDGMSVSSAGIRAALADGDVRLAEKMLGREYTVTAPVIQGRQLGRKWGFPSPIFRGWKSASC